MTALGRGAVRARADRAGILRDGLPRDAPSEFHSNGGGGTGGEGGIEG